MPIMLARTEKHGPRFLPTVCESYFCPLVWCVTRLKPVVELSDLPIFLYNGPARM